MKKIKKNRKFTKNIAIGFGVATVAATPLISTAVCAENHKESSSNVAKSQANNGFAAKANASNKTDEQIVDAVLPRDLDFPKPDPNVSPADVPQPANGVTKSGVKYTFLLWESVTPKGEIYWTVELDKGVVIRPMYGTLVGYKIIP